jgi:hypothetical protein
MYPMSTTHAEPKQMRRSRLTAQISSRKSKGLATPGTLAIRQSEGKISPIYGDVHQLVTHLDADVQALTRLQSCLTGLRRVYATGIKRQLCC